MDRTVKEQPQAQKPMTTDATQSNGEGNGTKQVKFGTARYSFYPSTEPLQEDGSSPSIQRPPAAITKPICPSSPPQRGLPVQPPQRVQPVFPALPLQPSQPTQNGESGQNGKVGQGGSAEEGEEEEPTLRGGATGNCCTEPFGCCLHWAKNICGDGTS